MYMYMMIELDINVLRMKDDMKFMEELLRERAVMVLPGHCFMTHSHEWVVVEAPADLVVEECQRK